MKLFNWYRLAVFTVAGVGYFHIQNDVPLWLEVVASVGCAVSAEFMVKFLVDTMRGLIWLFSDKD